MTVQHVQALETALQGNDVCAAWVIWSSAAEGALPDGLVGGRGAARFLAVRLGGPRVRKVRRTLADSGEGDGVFFIAMLLWPLCLTLALGFRLLGMRWMVCCMMEFLVWVT